MAKVATLGALASAPQQIGGDALKIGTSVKRKTPSELRGEQLKMTNVAELVHKSLAPSDMENGLKKPDPQRNPRYIDIRMNEVFPSKKPRFKLPSGKENSKDNSSVEQPSCLKKISAFSSMAAKKRKQLSCPEGFVASVDVPKEDDVTNAHRTLEKCNQGTFLSVTELSSGGQKLSGLATVNMDKALKGLAACEAIPNLPSDSSERFDDLSKGNFCSDYNVTGKKIPLDFTLKTYVRLVSSSSVNWLHRSMMSGTYNGMPQFTPRSGSFEDQNISSASQTRLASQVLNSNTLHSWIYPQSTLPPSLISVLISAAADGAEMDFLRKRVGVWEESFRSLYYMFRENVCSIFYVCTSHFVVMFTATDDSGRSRRSYHAYISQSTRGLRSLLKEQDVSFSMPLCHSQVEHVTTEVLLELSEIEKHKLGQTRRTNSFSDIDNTPQSLLVFVGNQNVHGLYEILLNYRSFLTFLNAVDVPVLYSPIPFQHATLSAPEVKCMEIKMADHGASVPQGSILKDGHSIPISSSGLCYSIEIKDSYIPPWIISNICAQMSSKGQRFEASFTTEHTSVGLNTALGTLCEIAGSSEATSDENTQEIIGYSFGVPEAIVSPHLNSGLLKELKYCDGSYIVSHPCMTLYNALTSLGGEGYI
ncbi:protein downstream neighbor of son homolog isoform X2 [Hibiscus syriacus]|uniref:protein downstream neighbor of son homolog isoform X2 n=1 Tax=Hibiscus syriacus TaxID=106335 RepID=UPI001922E37C|nr:protein downstream neighbor of son homolog isoform X2 [Hibiscus syriacus]